MLKIILFFILTIQIENKTSKYEKAYKNLKKKM